MHSPQEIPRHSNANPESETTTKTKRKQNIIIKRVVMKTESTEIRTGKDMYNGDGLYSCIINIALDDISTLSNCRLLHGVMADGKKQY